MTDRELLELAAKAAGLVIEKWITAMGGEYAVTNKHSEITAWNPLECSADALNLAAELGIDLYFQQLNVQARKSKPFVEYYCVNKSSATRRAIVRAAADIGEQIS